ncbi:hypothetical protein [Aureispira anguillae]|uniref:Uncharacterized protein n=1 Tax=Aureispira anguillae TaxID=2864201 RepID=A0A915YHZ9_9BACT|nr:hypothetical protein [Aureispira anguillae]BDS13543.1 hypothetical protein AsAng_0042820 [Aureispira anguillae]
MDFFSGIIGLIVGTILSLVGGIWLTRREVARHHAIASQEEESTNQLDQTVPLEKKLRDAIYDCERNLLACKKQIDEICKNQLDLLQDVGKKSHVAVSNKPLFFEYYNPNTQERHFYYQKDLAKDIAQEVLENTKNIAQKYNNHIQLVLTQQELFEKLIESHQENLNRILGVKTQSNQVKKITQHHHKLSQLNEDNQLETKAIYNEMLIQDISEELAHQEECLRQYIALNKQYDHPSDQQTEEKLRIQIKMIINQLEEEDPSNSQ